MLRPVLDLPKAHLHLHFTGSMRVDTVRAIVADVAARVRALLDSLA